MTLQANVCKFWYYYSWQFKANNWPKMIEFVICEPFSTFSFTPSTSKQFVFSFNHSKFQIVELCSEMFVWNIYPPQKNSNINKNFLSRELIESSSRLLISHTLWFICRLSLLQIFWCVKFVGFIKFHRNFVCGPDEIISSLRDLNNHKGSSNLCESIIRVETRVFR
jgi:hypothetical protein